MQGDHLGKFLIHYHSDLCFLGICNSMSLLCDIHTANCKWTASVAGGLGYGSWGSGDLAPGEAPSLVWICLAPQAEQGA